MQKRSNPFAKRPNPFEEVVETPQEQPVVVEEPVVEEFKEEEPEIYVPQTPTPAPKQQPRVQQTVQSNRYTGYNAPKVENNRVKYTSTMDQDLRREIKFACVTKGIMFAQFVEEACMEKLRRERGR